MRKSGDRVLITLGTCVVVLMGLFCFAIPQVQAAQFDTGFLERLLAA